MIYQRACDIVTDDVFLELDRILPDSRLFLKLEGMNPAGSVKLKSALGMVEDAERKGRLWPGGRIVESSSGSLGIALSVIAAARGYHFTCVTDPNVSPQSLALIRALGGEVVEVTRRDHNGGYLGTRIALIREMTAADPGLVWLNQYANPANAQAHAQRTATSILKNIGHVDVLLVGAGTTGTLMGCTRHFRAFSPWTRIIAVDTAGSVTFGGPPGPRYIPGLGTSRRPELCRPDRVDEIVLVDESDAVRMCRRLARDHGLPAGGSTGSVLAALESVADRVPPGSRVVALSPDMGDRYVKTIYDDLWVADTFGADVLDDADARPVAV
ncbi:2,3-diaminopropionate biosynthesis protein SbnA [Streptomyces griseoviridis]|uniref:2,3-diaminopropionate biosynthesis protein SbnA n=2 Tax=Streptomyces TaxID=1883 RepID=A0A3S9ZMF2_STRGD|nr:MULTISPECIES: 2,3-diaminopropionate biosynthesis protein SbnA [Streptomyces]AZS89060.1 2,3-diaminopropionate biosynthesis protein SbnA [Streptomyces griseoviridis]MDH6697742.1 2,3-diaminopropionate biosynthesis protein SbnA [Streptomyces sp. MAA16]MDT0472404.1 2,3-diaminopropionate biosynthesis protein SbnA [Streptomyces sp. DSM 41014]QCN84093.1 2,3-diaminopropionate biosynthesis protein SbnA [Streptomyces griseoviridis]